MDAEGTVGGIRLLRFLDDLEDFGLLVKVRLRKGQDVPGVGVGEVERRDPEDQYGRERFVPMPLENEPATDRQHH